MKRKKVQVGRWVQGVHLTTIHDGVIELAVLKDGPFTIKMDIDAAEQFRRQLDRCISEAKARRGERNGIAVFPS